MKIRTLCFIAVFSLLAAGAVSAMDKEGVEKTKPFWQNHNEIFNHTYVYQCVGNEDNSLFLMNAVIEEGWHNTIYVFTSDKYYYSNNMHAIWDQGASEGDVRDLIFSPYSKKFYFTAAWENEADLERNSYGLWIGTQTGKEWEPISLSHQTMEIGIGHLAVNKCGVWLLHDKANWDVEDGWRSSELYQIEDTKGRFVFKIPDSVLDIKFHSYWTFENPWTESLLDDPENTSETRLNLRNTDYTLIIRDKDESSWWVYNCITDGVEKFADYATALSKAQEIGLKQNKKLFIQGIQTPGRVVFELCAVIAFILSAIFIITLLLHKNRRMKKTARTLKEHNQMIFEIQEKERAKISRDIHDSVVQDIRVLRLETENLVVDEGSKLKQTKIEDLATDCIVKLRNICYNLTPAELASHNDGDSSKLELISIINSLVQQFSARTHIPCIFKVDQGFEYPVLEKEETQNLFRVIQESLTNIEKHSYATQVSIFIKKDGNNLLIYITDDGIGCNPDELKRKLRSKEHLGLKSMKDRMDLIGGSIDFFTEQNNGMEITIKLPLESE